MRFVQIFHSNHIIVSHHHIVYNSSNVVVCTVNFCQTVVCCSGAPCVVYCEALPSAV